VRLWAGVLSVVPGSRLLLKGKSLGVESVRRRMVDRLARAGVDAARVECLSELPEYGSHLEAYSRVDVALDPAPYNGTTTTCEALCMGVPVVTLEGAVHAARVGASLLTAAGVPEWIARDGEAYIRIAAELAGDRERRIGLRETLRPRLLASRLCDGAAHGRALEAGLRTLWRDWCAGRAAG
jgi:predicted O-linked N-acetylglucosamine transferase (SPINDLY family)